MKLFLWLAFLILINSNLFSDEQPITYDSISHAVIINQPVGEGIHISDYFDFYFLEKNESYNDSLILDSTFNSKFKIITSFYDNYRDRLNDTNKLNDTSLKRTWNRVKIVNKLNFSQELILSHYLSDTVLFYEFRNNHIINVKVKIKGSLEDADIYKPGRIFKIYLLPNDTVTYYFKPTAFYHENMTCEIEGLKQYYKNDIYKTTLVIFLLTIGLSTIIYVIIFGYNSKEKIYFYYLFYILSIFINLLLISNIDYLLFKKSILISVEKYHPFPFYDILFIFSILFLKNFLNIKLHFKKWNKFYNYSILYALFLFIFITCSWNLFSFLKGLPDFFYDIFFGMYVALFPIFTICIVSIIIIAYKLYKYNKQKSAIFVLVGWLPIFFMCVIIPLILLFVQFVIEAEISDTIGKFFGGGVIIILIYETYVFFFGISYQSKLNKKELEKKNIENQKLEFEKQFEIKEKELTEKLLLNILPESIAERLKSGETTIADLFNEASVIFIDIVDFTKMSAKSTPQKLVNLLNDVFTIFDKLSAKYGLEKIKTIGDCYMAASGIPLAKSNHAESVANMALEVLEIMKNYRFDADLDKTFEVLKTSDVSDDDKILIQFRIGLDCGPIVAGVIGEQKYVYDLWGDTVNTASRMEEYSEVGKIQVTERFKAKLEESSPLISRQRVTEQIYPPLKVMALR